MGEMDEGPGAKAFHETDIGRQFYERTMPTIAQHLTALTIIGNQLKRLNENIDALRGVLEKLGERPEPPTAEAGEPGIIQYLRQEAERLIGRTLPS